MEVIVGEIYKLNQHRDKRVIVVSNDDGVVVQVLDHIGHWSPGETTLYVGRGDVLRLSIDELFIPQLHGENEDLIKYLRKFDEVM